MDYTFKKHPLSDAERRWLQEVASAENFDPKVAMVRLFGKLPKDFDPRNIDSRLYANRRLTLVGLWHVAPEHKIFVQIKGVVEYIRKRIFESPGVEMFTAADISEGTNQSVDDVACALYELSQIGGWCSGSSGSNGRTESVHLTGDHAYDEYLSYDGIDDLLEKYYVSRKPQKNDVWSALTDRDSRPDLESFGRAVEKKVFKPKTAFVLMAIDRSKPELEDAYSVIKRVSERFGITAYRADDIEHQGRITDRILDEIGTCEFLIADLSYERPNVYYEIGFAHAINKNPILYRRTGTQLHFDLSVHNAPEYKNFTELEEMLIKRFEAILGRKAKIAEN